MRFTQHTALKAADRIRELEAKIEAALNCKVYVIVLGDENNSATAPGFLVSDIQAALQDKAND